MGVKEQKCYDVNESNTNTTTSAGQVLDTTTVQMIHIMRIHSSQMSNCCTLDEFYNNTAERRADYNGKMWLDGCWRNWGEGNC